MVSFEILREKYVIQARPSKIDSLVHVRRLAAMLHIPYSYFPTVFCVVRWHKETSLQSELCPVSAIDK